MIDWKFKKLLIDLKKKDPEKRLEAIQKLHFYKQQSDLEFEMDTFKDIIKAAASTFPEPVDEWDNPSYHLIDFVVDYPHETTIKALMKYFDKLHVHAQYRAIQSLLSTEDEQVFYFLEDKIIELLEKNQLNIPIEELSNYPLLVKAIVDKTIHKLHSSEHKFTMYELLLTINASGYAKNFKADLVLPILLEDYRLEKESFLSYNEDYSLNFVYTSWKDTYYFTRNRMTIYIRLMAFYFNEEIQQELNIALTFKDPLLKARALSVCLEKNLPYPADLIAECASNIESAEFTYRMLMAKNLEHLYPYPKEAQFYIAKTRLFFELVNLDSEEPIFPTNLQIIDHLEIDTYYEDLAKFYLMTFENYGTTYVGWAGGFVETEEKELEIFDGTFSEFVEFDAMSIEEHKQAFLKKDLEHKENYQEEIYYESSPKLPHITYFFMVMIGAKWFEVLLGGRTSLIATTIATLLLLTYVGYKLSTNKKRKIQIIGKQIVKLDGATVVSIPMKDIKNVKRKKKMMIVLNQNDEVVMEVPMPWVNYQLFSFELRRHTSFLSNPPFIEE